MTRRAYLELGLALLAPLGVTAQAPATAVRVEYDVEFSTQGPLGQTGGTCRDSGTDMLQGTLVEVVPLTRHDVGEFVGYLSRTTSMSVCGERMNHLNEGVECSSGIQGGQYAYVQLRVQPDSQGGYLKFINNPQARPRMRLPLPPTVQVRSVVNGTCDPMEMADMQVKYDQGSTGGSPDGQPLEILAFPPASYPGVYAPNPPQSIWTLKVLRRRP